jgi:hypothetical protein
MQDPSWARPYVRHATALLALKQYTAAEATLKQGMAALQQGTQQQCDGRGALQELRNALQEVRAAVSAAADTGQGTKSASSTAAVHQLGPEGPLPVAKRPKLEDQGTASVTGKSTTHT